MFGDMKSLLEGLSNDRDEAAIRRILRELTGSQTGLDETVRHDLLRCATMAWHHGSRMRLQSEDGFDALAALCLVLGQGRGAFFENLFVTRTVNDESLSATHKLNRLIEIVLGTVARPAPCFSNDNGVRETA